MKRKTAAMVLGAVLALPGSLAGCTAFPQEFTARPGVAAEERAQAYATCRAKADAAPISTVERENWTFSGTAHESLLEGCMEAAGYQLNPLLQW